MVSYNGIQYSIMSFFNIKVHSIFANKKMLHYFMINVTTINNTL